MNCMSEEQMKTAFKKMKLHYLMHHLDDFVSLASKNKLAPRQLIEQLLSLEMQESQALSVQSRLKSAKLGKFAPIANFDWNWPKTISRPSIEKLLALNFIDEPANAIFIGTAGLGKTMIAKNIGYQAALAGKSVYFSEAAEALEELGSMASPLTFKRRIAKYTKPDLLILDEVGYLSHSAKSADVLFHIINRRHEKSSTIITTNKSFTDWGTVFPGAGCVVAMVDRLTECAEVLLIEGPSYRLRKSEERRQLATTTTTTTTKATKEKSHAHK